MSTAENTAAEMRDVYERVTSQIVNAIEKGVSRTDGGRNKQLSFAEIH